MRTMTCSCSIFAEPCEEIATDEDGLCYICRAVWTEPRITHKLLRVSVGLSMHQNLTNVWIPEEEPDE